MSHPTCPISAVNIVSQNETLGTQRDNLYNINYRGKPIPGFAREIILKVLETCEQEAKTNFPMFLLNAPIKRAAAYTGVSEKTIQRISDENRKRRMEMTNDGNKRIKLADYSQNEVDASNIKKETGLVIPNCAREIISRVISSCYQEFEQGAFLTPLIWKSSRVALYTGVSIGTIQRIKKEDQKRKQMNGQKMLQTPGRQRKRTTFRDRINDINFHGIRMVIDDLILNKKDFPTCRSLYNAVKESNIDFPYSEGTFLCFLRNKGFTWKLGGTRKRLLVEKEEIIKSRAHCINKIKSHEKDGHLIVYLDDRFIQAGIDTTYCHKNNEYAGEKRITASGRLIVLTEFSAVGMARRGYKMFHPGAEGLDENPSVSEVEKWLVENLFPNIPSNTLIVMSTNAYGQNDDFETIPNESSSKSALIEFLKLKNVKYKHAQTSPELYGILKEYLENLPRPWIQIDEIFEKHGYSFLRLPPHLSGLNPIELACSDVKTYVRDKVAPSKANFNAVKDTTLQVLESFHSDTFQSYMDHVIKMENYFVDREKSLLEHYDRVANKNKDSDSNNAVDKNLSVDSESSCNSLSCENDSGSTENVLGSTLETLDTQTVCEKIIATPDIDTTVVMTESQDLDDDADDNDGKPGPS